MSLLFAPAFLTFQNSLECVGISASAAAFAQHCIKICFQVEQFLTPTSLVIAYLEVIRWQNFFLSSYQIFAVILVMSKLDAVKKLSFCSICKDVSTNSFSVTNCGNCVLNFFDIFTLLNSQTTTCCAINSVFPKQCFACVKKLLLSKHWTQL